MTELEFAERLKKYRKARGLTQQELADLLGVSNKSVSRWESGSYPDVATLGPLARALGVAVDDLLNEKAPIRSLEKSDWQNLLSFAFALGGGVLYFLLVLFTPVPVTYLLYLGAMAYGVYLQKHYTYHSRWFRIANLCMNFFVNCHMVSALLRTLGVLVLPSPALLSQVLRLLLLENAGAMLLPYLLYLLSCAAVTALTGWLIRRYSGGEAVKLPRLSLEKAPMTRRKLVPVGLMLLVAAFWAIYLPTGRTRIPETFYLVQDDCYMLLLLFCAAVCVLAFNWREHRGMLLPSLPLVGACRLLTGLLDWSNVYNAPNRNVYFSPSAFTFGDYRFGRPTAGLYAALLVFTFLYLVCCKIRIKRSNITSL